MQESCNAANAALAVVGSWAAALHLVASMTVSRPRGRAHPCVVNETEVEVSFGLTSCIRAMTLSQPAFGSLFSRVNCNGSPHVCQIPRVMFGLGPGHPRIKPAGLRIAPELRQYANVV